jgi:hypothetical protein
LEGLQEKSLLLVDEIELALHPMAQVNFYNFLEGIVQDKDLTCFISTHSRTLISMAKNRIFLENNDGKISVIKDCSPAYILSDISVPTDYIPDFVFFVEDVMARKYLEQIVKYLLDEYELTSNVKVVEVGGWYQLLLFTKRWMRIPPFSNQKVYAFPDEDVDGTIKKCRSQNINMEAVDVYDSIRNNTIFLDITPDLGVWNWIQTNPELLGKDISNELDRLTCKLPYVVEKVIHEEENSNVDKPINHAKDCLKNLLQSLMETEDFMNEDKFKTVIFKSYVRARMQESSYKNDWLHKIMPTLNHK